MGIFFHSLDRPLWSKCDPPAIVKTLLPSLLAMLGRGDGSCSPTLSAGWHFPSSWNRGWWPWKDSIYWVTITCGVCSLVFLERRAAVICETLFHLCSEIVLKRLQYCVILNTKVSLGILKVFIRYKTTGVLTTEIWKSTLFKKTKGYSIKLLNLNSSRTDSVSVKNSVCYLPLLLSPVSYTHLTLPTKA